jgi:chromosome segregation ATPase
MTLEDNARKCCDDIEGIGQDTERLKGSCAQEAKKDLSSFEARLERFLTEAKEARKKLDAGIREGLEGLIDAWNQARDRLRGHLRLIDAKSSLASARRLAADQYYVAAESELTTALRRVTEARPFLQKEDVHLTELVEEIERAVKEIHEKADTAATTLEKVVASNERLLGKIEKAG